MDNQFSTTFIPKKPIVAAPSGGGQVSRPSGLLTTLATLLFFLTILIAGGVYAWQGYETSNVATLADSVSKVEQSFEPDLITKLQTLDRQLKDGNAVLQNHTVISPVFDVLESSTLKQVRFTKFDASFDQSGTLSVKMSGQADSYQTIAQQSDVLGANAFFQNVLFSNFVLTQQGKISFDLSFSVKGDLVSFEKAPLAQNSQTQTAAPAPVITTQ